MKRLLESTTVLLLWASAAFSREAPPQRDQSLLARVTVYWASGGHGSDRYTRQHKASTGLRLQTGHCAVDPRKIPYGSQIIFPDRTRLIAVDTGTAVRNRKAARLSGRTATERNAVVVDRFFETKRQALAWAARNPTFMSLRVVAPNSRPQTTVITTQRIQTVVTSAPAANNSPPLPKPRLAVPNHGYKFM